MAADTGLFSEGKHPRTLESESKRHVMVTAQKPPLGDKGRPITDATFNAQGKIMFNMIRRLAQHGVGNGPTSQSLFKVIGSTSTDNYFEVTTAASTDYEAMPTFLVGGLQAILPVAAGSIAMDTTAANSQWLHLQTDTSATGAQTVFACSNAFWPNLGARTVRILQNNGTWATRTLASNTNGTFTITASITVGAGAAEVPPNAYFYFQATTPGAARDDGIWLDVFLQEVGGVAPLSGTTAATYTDSTIDDVIGTTSSYETARRFRVKQHVFLAQDDDNVGGGFIDGGGTSIADSAVWWVDAGGVTHISVLLATLSRTTNAKILPHMVRDARISVGDTARKDVATVLNDLARGAWIGDLPTITRTNADTVTIGAGSTLCFFGYGYVLRTVPQRAFTTRSDGTAWGNSTTHYIYADTSTGQYMCETSLGSDSAPVLRFTSDGSGDLPSFVTEGTTYEDLRRAVPVSDVFNFDTDKRIRNTLAFRNSVSNSSVVGLDFYNKAGTFKGTLAFNEAAGGFFVSPESTELFRALGGGGAMLTLDATNPSASLEATDGVTFTGDAGTPWDATAVPVWEFAETQHGVLRSTAGVEYGVAGGAVTPVTKTMFIPANRGSYMNPPAFSSGGDGDNMCGFVGDWYQLRLDSAGAANALKLTGGDLAMDGTSIGHAMVLIPIEAPVGWDIGDVTLYALGEGFGVTQTATLSMKLWYRDSFGSKEASAVSTLQDASDLTFGTTSVTKTIAAGLAPNTYPCVYAGICLKNVTNLTAGRLIVQGVTAELTYRGIGAYSLDNSLGNVLPGLEA